MTKASCNSGPCAALVQVVVHCWGGGGRTGKVLAAWLASHYKLSVEDASKEVEATSKGQGTSRRVDQKAVAELLGS